jgi:chromosome segregation ATPase
MTPDMKAQIENDLSSIYDLMQENEQALSALRQQLKASGIKNKQLEETLALYEEQMKQKDEEISTLKQKLEEMNFNMEKLNEKIDQMASNLDSMANVQQQQSQVINQQDKALHTVYYVVGTKDELKSHNIVSKSGILSKLSVDGNFDKSYFTEIDNRNLSEIPVHSKKIQILTTHPSGSYTEVETDGEVAKIKITDKEKFWSLSKFCVILAK